jgi:hypothetical protein
MPLSRFVKGDQQSFLTNAMQDSAGFYVALAQAQVAHVESEPFRFDRASTASLG